jgi:serine/threonine protein phosphatase PrpC
MMRLVKTVGSWLGLLADLFDPDTDRDADQPGDRSPPYRPVSEPQIPEQQPAGGGPVRHRVGGGTHQPQRSAVITEASPQAPARSRLAWQPPVIGRPVGDFAARPSTATAYRPDCIADGWATNNFTVRLASVRGYEHRYTGAPRQDDVAVAHHAATGAVLFAVADGVSSAPLSHIGASAACRAAIGAMTAALESPDRLVDWPGVVEHAAWQLCEQARISLRLPDIDQRAADEQMATTLVAGLVLPGPDEPLVQLIQVGDSSAWILSADGRYTCLLPTKHRSGEEVFTSAVTALPRVPPVEMRHGTLAVDEILLVGTDGFGDPLGDGEGAVGRYFADALTSVPPVLKFANDLDFSRETYDDDRTLFALWSGRRSGAR